MAGSVNSVRRYRRAHHAHLLPPRTSARDASRGVMGPAVSFLAVLP